MIEQHTEQAKTALDGVIAAGAITSPIWLTNLNNYVGLFCLYGGAVLLVIRIAIAWKDWRSK